MSEPTDFSERWGKNVMRRFVREYHIESYEHFLAELEARVDTEILPSIFVRRIENGYQFAGGSRQCES